jgi:Lrp/AsnC family transcriptional regulator for asnA, asnC and gidA
MTDFGITIGCVQGGEVAMTSTNGLKPIDTPDESDADADVDGQHGAAYRRALGNDPLNKQIIEKLQADGRLPYSAIARELGTSEGTIRNRVNQMLAAKVLQVIAVVDPLALGHEGYAMIAMKVAGGADPRVVGKRFEACEEVTYILFAAGQYDLLVEVICRTQGELRDFLLDHCYGHADIASVEPLLALAMYKNLLKWGQP